MIFAWLKHRKSLRSAAARLYQSAVAQSRDPRFYTDYGVADTMDGRFDMICLHVFLIVNRLKMAGGKGEILAQALFDRMFVTMDFTLREIGVGDLSVPKHMKKMMKAFNGRMHSYHAALHAEGGRQDLQEAVVRNVYRSNDPAALPEVQAMAEYVSLASAALLQQDFESLEAGRVCFPAVPALRKAHA